MSKIRFVLVSLLLSLLFAACSSDKSGVSATSTDSLAQAAVDSIGKNLSDSLRQVLKDSVSRWMQDSLQGKAVSDSVYDRLYASVFAKTYASLKAKQDSLLALRDSVLRDSLRIKLYDSLYAAVYADLYSERAGDYVWILSLQANSNLYPALIPYGPVIYADSMQQGLVSLKITNMGTEYYQVSLEGQIDGFSSMARTTRYLYPHDTIILSVIPALNYMALNAITDATPSTLHYWLKVTRNGKDITLDEETVNTTVASPQVYTNSMTYGNTRVAIAEDPEWVTPASDSITALLRDAAALHPRSSLVGYQTYSGMTQDASVRSQVAVIYQALQARKILYVNTPFSPTGGQRIKYPSDVMHDKSANCIEGAFLFSSALEALGIEPLVVVIPSHAFVGWHTWNNTTVSSFLETTQAWSVNSVPFDSAAAYGDREFTAQSDSGNFSNGKSVIHDIEQLRTTYGYTPWPGK